MENKRIENAVKIINHAINYNISLKKASVECGYSDTYVKNIKMELFFEREHGVVSTGDISPLISALARYEQLKTSKQIYHDKEKDVIKSETPTQKPQDNPKLPAGENTRFTGEDDGNASAEWTWNKNYPPDHIKTLDELLETCKVDESIWKVDSFVVNKWDVTSFKLGEPITVQNYQVKARLIRRVAELREQKLEEMFINMVKNYTPPIANIKPRDFFTYKENNLLEISIFDLHMGKLAWGGETFENYDTKIARTRFLYAIETLLKHAGGFQFSKILFPVGNDFFNSDTLENTTTKGTPQDEDLRWQKTFNVGVGLLIDGINILKQTGVPIEIMVIPGNHDFQRSHYMGMYLSAWFRNDVQVSINNHASPRKYFRFGKVLLGFTHGSEEKEASLPMIMANDIEAKPHWSDTTYHEWHLGHIHRKRNLKYTILEKDRTLNEDLGVTVRYLSSLTGTEEWHHKKGFIGCTKAADAFIWNYEFGLVAHLNTNLIIE